MNPGHKDDRQPSQPAIAPDQGDHVTSATARHGMNRTGPPAGIIFDPDILARDLQLDLVLRRSAVMVAVLAIGAVVYLDRVGSTVGFALVVLLVVGWMWMNSISAGVWRSLPSVTAMISRDPESAEAGLAELMRRRPLVPWVRLLLYHRLAAIRHQQQRFGESAAICRELLNRSLGPVRKVRGALLLMLAEASLQCRDLYGAYSALSELRRENLNVAERLQWLALQTRYEVLIGSDQAVLNGVRHKLLWAELMPADHCGAVHAMMYVAARRAGKTELADWLYRRSELLCDPTRLQRLLHSGFAIRVVGPPQ